jgi:TolB protein
MKIVQAKIAVPGLMMVIILNRAWAAGEPSLNGPFPEHQDVGKATRAGSVTYDQAKGSYLISGGGDNMWFTNDAFHFAWKQMSGDLRLAADIHWSGTNGNAHRKACLMFRQTLEADSPYADVAVHGNGLTSLQYREAKGELTREIQAGVSAPSRVALEKRGRFVSLSIAASGDRLEPSGAVYEMRFEEPFYVGLAVCAHDADRVETASFSGIEIAPLPPPEGAAKKVRSALEVVPISSKDRRVVYHTNDRIEAPNWSRDGRFFLFNTGGRLYKLPASGGQPAPIDTGLRIKCNNDHGISPDGKQLAISDQSEGGKSLIYTLPIGGGTPHRLTSVGPSYWHGWSPDGTTLAYCAERNGEFDVYTMTASGGEEKRLTTTPGLDDGPEYSPDGRFIYFNSERSGTMQIWRMKPDGTGQEQITSDGYNNWFAHPSPDGKWLVFLSYEKSVKGHPENQEVMLRLMPVAGGQVQVLAKLFGGQGTINVPSWSPDSKNVAFVSYEPVP